MIIIINVDFTMPSFNIFTKSREKGMSFTFQKRNQAILFLIISATLIYIAFLSSYLNQESIIYKDCNCNKDTNNPKNVIKTIRRESQRYIDYASTTIEVEEEPEASGDIVADPNDDKMKKVSNYFDVIENESKNDTHKVEGAKYYMKKRFERVVQLQNKHTPSWAHPQPFFVFPNGQQIEAAIIVTNQRFDAWKDKMLQNEAACKQVNLFRSYKPRQGYCSWCPTPDAKQSFFKNVNQQFRCLNGTMVMVGSREEKGKSVRPSEASYIDQRLDLAGVVKKPSVYAAVTRTAYFTCTLSLDQEVPLGVDGTVMFMLDPSIDPIIGAVRRYQSYVENDPDLMKENFKKSDLIRDKGTHVINLNYERYLRDIIANRKGAYSNPSIANKHVICSRALFGNVDGDFLVATSRFYASQGFTRTVYYDAGMVNLRNQGSVEKAIREGIITWVDMKPWLQEAYGYLQTDMLTLSKDLVQVFLRYDCFLRAKSNGAQWALFVDPDEIIFPGIKGWMNIEDPSNNVPAQGKLKDLASYVDTAPRNITFVSFASLRTIDDPILCLSPRNWPTGEELMTKIMDYHIKTEHSQLSSLVHWNRKLCTSFERCVHAAGWRKYAIRLSQTTYLGNIEVHGADCSGFIPWLVPKELDSPYVDYLRIGEESGYHSHVDTYHMRHLQCTSHFGKLNKQENSIQGWFK